MPAPIPEALLERAYRHAAGSASTGWPAPRAFPWTRCGRRKVARVVAEVDSDPASACKVCYGRPCARRRSLWQHHPDQTPPPNLAGAR